MPEPTLPELTLPEPTLPETAQPISVPDEAHAASVSPHGFPTLGEVASSDPTSLTGLFTEAAKAAVDAATTPAATIILRKFIAVSIGGRSAG